MNPNEKRPYQYRPVLFFVLTYLFTWIFWIPAAFMPEETGAVFMAAGLIAPAVVSTLFVLLSGSEALKQDLKKKLVGFYKVKWANVFLAVGVFALIVAGSILLFLAFGQKPDQFSFTKDFSFTGVGIGSALVGIAHLGAFYAVLAVIAFGAFIAQGAGKAGSAHTGAVTSGAVAAAAIDTTWAFFAIFAEIIARAGITAVAGKAFGANTEAALTEAA